MLIILLCLSVTISMLAALRLAEKRPFWKRNGEGAKNRTQPGSQAAGALTDYNHYRLNRSERIQYTLLAVLVTSAIGYIFFKNIYICVLLNIPAFFYPAAVKKKLVKKRKAILNMQFKDALYSLSSSLSAGKSPESAFKAALGDLKILYGDREAYIIKEFERINRKIEMNETLESALRDFARRADIDDVTNFVDVFSICKSTGGNLVEVIRNTANILHQKMDIKNELEILVAEQKFSQKILNVMPFALILLISSGSPDYIQPLYSPKGHAVMLVVLLLLLVSYALGNKITNIKV